MADTSQMVRLIRHAADRLADERPWPVLTEIAAAGQLAHVDRMALGGATSSLAAAMSLAEGVLRMVAACMEPESEPAISAVTTLRRMCADADEPYLRVDDVLEALGVFDAS